MCIDKITYKNLAPHSLSFSQDGSLLAVGFGNVLCTWDAITFNLKCVLSAPSCLDGSVNNVAILLPPKNSKITEEEQKTKIKDLVESRKKTLDQMKKVIMGEAGEDFLKKLTCEKQRNFDKSSINYEQPNELSQKEKHWIFKKIFMMNELSFKKKIQLLHRLNIACQFGDYLQEEINEYFKKNCENKEDLKNLLKNQVTSVNDCEKYKLMLKLQKSLNQINKNQEIFPSKKILKFSGASVDDILDIIKENSKKSKNEKDNKQSVKKDKKSKDFQGVLTKITNVLFCTEEFSHLVVVTTQDRLLIWNLLTLKLQASYKLSVKCITIDWVSNLIAAFTKNNECEYFYC